MRRALWLSLAAALACLLLAPAGAAAAPRALLVYVSMGDLPPVDEEAAGQQVGALLRSFDARPELALGLVSATQGNYSEEQALLDVTQGNRVSPTAYDPSLPATLRLVPRGPGGTIGGWKSVLRRADTAPATIDPGLLASSIPGGAAYAGAEGERATDAVAAADRAGRVSRLSLGPARTLFARTRELLREHRFVVVTLPSEQADADLDALLQTRAPDELIVVTQQPPDRKVLQLLPIGLAAEGSGGRGLTSDSTHRRGLVTGIDVAPTILRHLDLRVPGAMTGSSIRTGTRSSPAALEDLRDRYGHIAPRRIRTLQALLGMWALLIGACALAGRARAGMRIGALAFMWLPVLVLVPGVLDPDRGSVEVALIALPAFALAAITDRLLGWPRAPAAPAAVTLSVYLADLATGSNLITLSLLGPNPRAGARFYGIGNELEPTLPILLFVGLAAAMTGRERSRGGAALFGISGLALALAIGSGKLGADVGGVITGSVGAAVAALLMLPGHVRLRVAAALFVAVPVLAVGALALLDTVTGADSHFSRNVLETQGGTSLWETVQRRYEFAYHALFRGFMPVVFALALLAAVVALVYRDRLYSRLPGPAWRAALGGGLAAGTAGAVTNDSGPLLFVVAVFVLGVVTAYLHGEPREGAAGALHSPGASSAGAGPEPRPVHVA